MKRINSGASGHPARGFTVIELLVTIAVLTIIISMGVPLYGQFTMSSQISQRTSDLVGSFNLARSEAVSQNRTMTISAINGNWNQGWNITRDPDGLLIRTVPLASNSGSQVMVTPTPAATTWGFDREGRMLVDGAFSDTTFVLCGNTKGKAHQGRTITVTRFGRLQVVPRTCP